MAIDIDAVNQSKLMLKPYDDYLIQKMLLGILRNILLKKIRKTHREKFLRGTGQSCSMNISRKRGQDQSLKS